MPCAECSAQSGEILPCFDVTQLSPFWVFAAGAATAAAWAQTSAANYPDHPIRVIVSVPAGGGVDTVTRLVTAKMQTMLGQPIVVENQAGVGGSIAAD